MNAPALSGEFVKEGTIIGTTTENDIWMIMQDCDKAFVDNVDLYFVKEIGFEAEIKSDYSVLVEPNGKNQVSTEAEFKEFFKKYPDIASKAELFMKIQKEKGLNAIVLAQSVIYGGYNYDDLDKRINSVADHFSQEVAKGNTYISEILRFNSNMPNANPNDPNSQSNSNNDGKRVNAEISGGLQNASSNNLIQPLDYGELKDENLENAEDWVKRVLAEARKHIGKAYVFGADRT